jgi:hypothetical protein
MTEKVLVKAGTQVYLLSEATWQRVLEESAQGREPQVVLAEHGAGRRIDSRFYDVTDWTEAEFESSVQSSSLYSRTGRAGSMTARSRGAYARLGRVVRKM